VARTGRENVRLLTSCPCPSWLPQVRRGAEPVSKKSTFFPRGLDRSLKSSWDQRQSAKGRHSARSTHYGLLCPGFSALGVLVQPVFVLRFLFSAFSAHTVHCAVRCTVHDRHTNEEYLTTCKFQNPHPPEPMCHTGPLFYRFLPVNVPAV
jgi:hypothetical protein